MSEATPEFKQQLRAAFDAIYVGQTVQSHGVSTTF